MALQKTSTVVEPFPLLVQEQNLAVEDSFLE